LTRIKHVVFDIGRVLVHWDAEIPYLDLIPDAKERQQFLTEICSPAWNVEQDRGRDWKEAESLLIAEYPEKEALIRAYRERWIEMVPYALEENVALLKQLLADGIDVTLLTNWNQDTWKEAQPHFPFLGSTRGVTVSGQVKLIKPDAEIFHLHAKTFNLDPTLSLFIDDSEKNIDAARALGWNTIHFVPDESLRTSLDAYKLEAIRS